MDPGSNIIGLMRFCSFIAFDIKDDFERFLISSNFHPHEESHKHDNHSNEVRFNPKFSKHCKCESVQY